MTEMQPCQPTEEDRNKTILKQIFTTANVGIALMDSQGRVIIANTYIVELFRITSREIDQIRYLDYVRPEEREEAAKSLSDLLTQKISQIDVQRRYCRPDGSEFWGHLIAKHCLDADGRFLGILAVLTDITEQKRQEQEQKAQASRLRLHNLLLSALSTSEAVQDGDIPRLAYELTETIGNALGVSRVSVWTLGEADAQLFCEDLFEVKTQTHTRGAILDESTCSNEMQELKTSRYVAADDARTDPKTAGYTKSYLVPHDIFSMLDCVVISGGRNLGVVCFEYTGEPHAWRPDEIAFGCQVADQVGMAILNRERLEVAAELRWDARVRQTLERLYLVLLGGEVSLPAISRAVLDEARTLLECEHGYVGNIGADNSLVPIAATDMPGDPTSWQTDLSAPVLLGKSLVGQIGLAGKTDGFTRRDEGGLAQIADFFALALQRVLAHDALASSTRLREEILRGISAGILVVDPQTRRIEDANDVAQAMFRTPLDQLRGQPCTTLNWHDASGRKITRCEARGHAIVHKDFLLHRPDGTNLPISKTVIPTLVDGKPKFVEVLFDISARKDMERQLTLAQKMESIGQLAAGIAHEINTPSQYVNDNLGFVSESFTSLTKLLTKTKERMADTGGAALWAEHDADFLLAEIPLALAQSQEGIGRITNIVQAMKRFSHPGGEQREMVNVNEALQNTALVSRNEWKYDADLVMNLDPDLPLVSCFGSDLNQVFLNVLVNAAHAVREKNAGSGAKGTVTISTQTLGESVEVTIADTGCGITPENLSRVFDPFFTTKPVGKGTGQGLAISYQIVVAKHGGTIEFHSTPGEGTQCVITLPITVQGAPHA